MRAALYSRVSTEEQSREGYSIPAQKDRLTAYVHSQEWDIVDYYVDEGYSAKDTNRPDLQRLIEDVKQRKVDVVLVHKLDRFTRSVKDLYALLDDFEKYKCGFRSAQEQFDTTTPMGRAMMGMLGIFAQWEREVIAERVYIGMEQKHLSGKRNGAIAPIGYDLVDGKLVINPVAADFVRKLFSLYTDHNGMPRITQILSGEGIDLNIRALHYILTNPVYCGKIRWNHRKEGKRTGQDMIVDGDHEPIISEEEFERVQDLRELRTRQGKGATSDFPFTGVLKCSRCGHDMVGGSRQLKSYRRRFYRCSGKINYGKCDMPMISEAAIEDAFMKNLRYSKKELTKLIVITENKPKRSETDDIERELAQIGKRKKKWQLAFANDAITLEELKAHTGEDKKREQELKSLLSTLPKMKENRWTKEEFIEQLIVLREAWGKIDDYAAKKGFINEMFESIVIETPVTNPRRGKNNSFDVFIREWHIK